MNGKNKGCIRFFLIGTAALAMICLALAAVSFIYNRAQASQAHGADRLSAVDKIRLAEVTHLRQALGDGVMPGWAEADIPLILYNEQHLFLSGLPDPEAGWRTVPKGAQRGTAWELVPGGEFLGQPYYRQKMAGPGQNSQAFTVRVGSRWVASLATLDWSRAGLAADVRQNLPGPVQPFAPYGVMINQLVPSSDMYISLVLHESMHAFQGIRAEDKLSAAENTYNQLHDQYPADDEAFTKAWQVELDLLTQALKAPTQEETQRLARAFLDQRAARRKAANLSPALVELERLKEWEEGIAKYAERSIYLQAAQDEGYQPLPELAQDSEFLNYEGAQRKWDQEVNQISRMAGDDAEGRFYYAGFAQAVLLDRLHPGWKERLFDEGVWLEDLLAQ